MQKQKEHSQTELNAQKAIQRDSGQLVYIQGYQQPKFDPQSIQEFATYIKTKQKKQKGQKRKEKLQKLRADFKNPQLRKQCNRQRHRKQKQKLNKQLQGKTQQEIKIFLKQRKQDKKKLQETLKKSMQTSSGISFLVDMNYEDKMNQKQIKSLASQIELMLRAGRMFQNPPNVHICGVKGKIKQQLQKMNYQYWKLKSHEEDITQCIKRNQFQDKTFYYLSPDGPQFVQEINKNCAFIIGGLVDRTVIKNASLNRANQLNLKARSLPIRDLMKNRNCLNLDHILSITCKYAQIKNWEQSFEYGAPCRWKKNYERKKNKPQKNEQQNQENHSDHEQIQQKQQALMMHQIQQKKNSQ